MTLQTSGLKDRMSRRDFLKIIRPKKHGMPFIPLFPQSMVKKIKTKIFMTKEHTWSFNLCPSCRIKTQFEKKMEEKIGA
jgi:hypothetical protein